MIGRAGLCALALAALVAGGCGSDDDGDDKADTGGATGVERPNRGFEGQTVNGCEIKPGTKCPDGKLDGASLYDAELNGAELTGAQMSKTDFERAHLRDATLNSIHAKGAGFSDADLTGAKLIKADLSANPGEPTADITNTILTAANLTGATVTDHQINRALLCDTTTPNGDVRNDDCPGREFDQPINGCVIKPGTQCPDANLQGADLRRANLKGANLKGANLTGAKLRSTDLTDAVLTGAKLDGVAYCHTTLPDGTQRIDGCNP